MVEPAKPLMAVVPAKGGLEVEAGLVYVATIALDRAIINADGRRYVLTPGLAATVDVRTGTRAIISYLLSPLQTSIAQAGRER